MPLQAVALASVILLVVTLRWSGEDDGRLKERGGPAAVFDTRPSAVVAELPPSVNRSTALAGSLAVGLSDAGTRAARRVVSELVSRSFELPAIVVPDQVALPALLTTTPLAAVESASIAPLALSELPLAADTSPPFSKE